jgi:hypothetical protein
VEEGGVTLEQFIALHGKPSEQFPGCVSLPKGMYTIVTEDDGVPVVKEFIPISDHGEN